jgi:hypothetical protein
MVATKLAMTLTAASSLLAAGDEQTVATLAQIQGNVLVSNGSAMASAAQPRRLSAGMRVLPSWRSSAVVVFDDGCLVVVGAGQRYEVESEPPCRARDADNRRPAIREAP